MLITVLVGVLSASSAWASPELSDRQIDRLETLSGLGKEACQKEDWESCHRMFAEAQELLPWAPHEFYIAQALVGMGRLLEGVALWQKILDDNPSSDDPILRQTIEAARKRLAEVRPEIPKLQFEVAPEHEGQVQVRLDGRLLETREHGEVFELDPGHHVVQLAQAGFVRERHDLELERNEHEKLAISLDPLTAPATQPKDDARQPSPLEADRSSWRPVVGWTATTLGTLTLVGGLVTFSVKEGRNEALERDCGGTTMERCMDLSREEYDQRVEAIEDRTTVSNVLLFSGGALLAGGVGLLIWDAVDDDAAGGAATVDASIGPGSAWLGVRRSF